MHIETRKPCSCQQRKNLGFIDRLMPIADTLFGGGSPSGTSPAGTSVTATTTVSPQIQVSPQISPVFQQQFQPTNSAATAGTTQTAPFSGGQGDGGLPALTGGGASAVPMPAIPSTPIDWSKWALYGGFGILALFALKMLKGKKPARRRTSRKIKRARKPVTRRGKAR